MFRAKSPAGAAPVGRERARRAPNVDPHQRAVSSSESLASTPGPAVRRIAGRELVGIQRSLGNKAFQRWLASPQIAAIQRNHHDQAAQQLWTQLGLTPNSFAPELQDGIGWLINERGGGNQYINPLLGALGAGSVHAITSAEMAKIPDKGVPQFSGNDVAKYYHGPVDKPSGDIWLIVKAGANLKEHRVGQALVHEYVHAINNDQHCNLLALRQGGDKANALRLFQGEFRAYYEANDFSTDVTKTKYKVVESIRAELKRLTDQHPADAELKRRCTQAYQITRHIFLDYRSVRETGAYKDITAFVLAFANQGRAAFGAI